MYIVFITLCICYCTKRVFIEEAPVSKYVTVFKSITRFPLMANGRRICCVVGVFLWLTVIWLQHAYRGAVLYGLHCTKPELQTTKNYYIIYLFITPN